MKESLHVNVEVGLLAEALVAEFAADRLRPFVDDLDVLPTAECGCELLTADLAAVHFLLVVHRKLVQNT